MTDEPIKQRVQFNKPMSMALAMRLVRVKQEKEMTWEQFFTWLLDMAEGVVRA